MKKQTTYKFNEQSLFHLIRQSRTVASNRIYADAPAIATFPKGKAIFSIAFIIPMRITLTVRFGERSLPYLIKTAVGQVCLHTCPTIKIYLSSLVPVTLTFALSAVISEIRAKSVWATVSFTASLKLTLSE